MRIILDTDKKTITVPWNYSDKLAKINKTIEDATGEKDKWSFSGYIDEIWKYAMEHSGTHIKTASKAAKNGNTNNQNG